MVYKSIKYKQTEKAFTKFAKKVVQQAQTILATRTGKRGRRNNRGPSNTKNSSLSKSLGFDLILYPSGALELQFKAADHFKFVEYGRKAGAKQPPPSVLKEWIRIKPLRLRDLSTGKYIEKSKKNINSVAYLIGRAIKEDGIPPRYFFRDAFKKAYKGLPQELANMYAKDVASFLRATINKNMTK